ncbi:MAG: thioredoxin family protein [Sphingobacterium sp.]|jgi:thiol-disulfide isomerase/thioredoxin|nr:thioredoxin family protein [Sphingobacterium sp.]
MKKYLILLAIFLVKFSLIAQNRTIQFKHDAAFETVLNEAKREKKLIFLDAYTSWCVPCKQMAKDVFTVDSIADFFNNTFINVGYDMEKGEGITLKKRYASDIAAYPTLLFIDGDGVVVHKIVGAPSAKEMINLSRPALDPKASLLGLAKRYENGDRSLSTLTAYFKVLGNAGDRAKIKEVATGYFDALTPAELKQSENWKVLGEYLYNTDSKTFNYIFSHQDEFARKVGKDKVLGYIIGNLSGEVGAASTAYYMKKPVDAQRQLKVMNMLRSIGDPRANELLLRLQLVDFRNKSDWASFNTTMLQLIGTDSPIKSLETKSSYLLNYTRKFIGSAPDDRLKDAIHWTDLLLATDLNPVYKKDLLDFQLKLYTQLKDQAMVQKVEQEIEVQNKLKEAEVAKGVKFNSAIRGFM